MTLWTDNATRFATTSDQRVRELRREAVTMAVDFIAAGYTPAAEDVMADCLEAQMRVEGIRPLEVIPGVGA